MPYKSFREWAKSSLIGHVVLFELTFSLTLLIVFLFLNYNQGTLTLAWAIYLVFMLAVVGAVLGITIWYVFTAKNVKRQGGNRD
jgi:heme/copper-type cytochrome/quinol oxidase subunit 4